MNKKITIETTSMSLHVMAMAIMLVDHFKKVFPDVALLVCIGRIAFPIFAFLIVEGYHHTRDLKKYASRLLFFALLAEIPADLMSGGMPFYSAHQNVLWTFLIGLGLIHINEKAKSTGKFAVRVLAAAGTVVAGYYIGMFTHVDYSQGGVLTVLAFYFFRGRSWWNFALQLVSMVYLNFAVLPSGILEFTLFGQDISFRRQGFAVLALIPIWLYRGKQGYHSKWLQILNYGFYPGHMLVIAVLAGSASPKVLLAFPAVAAVVLVWRLVGEKGRAFVKRQLDKVEDQTLLKAAAAAAVLLLVVAPFFSVQMRPVDRVNVFFYENAQSAQEGNYKSAFFTSPKDVKAWLAFREEAVPEEKQTSFYNFSSPYPHYAIWYIKGSDVVEGLFITQRESVLVQADGRSGEYVDYAPLNPYYRQAADMMAAAGN